MATEVLRIGKLFLTFESYQRVPDSNVPGIDELEILVSIENTDRPLGESGRAPAAELRDQDGQSYEPVNLDRAWYEPQEPDTRSQARLRFRVPASATALGLVLAAGDDEEAVVELDEALD